MGIGDEKTAFFSSFPVNEIHSSLKEKKPDPGRIQSLMFHLCVHNDFCSRNAEEVLACIHCGKCRACVHC